MADTALVNPASARTQKPPAGSMIERYELIRQLGQGGMGTVFLARDTTLGRLVALKLLTELGGSGVARFLVEARATARCKHENIVTIHEVGEHDECPFMVLEHIEGQSLHAWMKGRRIEREDGERPMAPVPASLCVELMVPVVRALICAHKLGIVHRDLKPGNIMLDASGPIKVLDFGIVVWSDLEPVQTAEDPRLWTATAYCMPIEVRQRLLDFPEEQARADLERCQRHVREVEAQSPNATGR